MLIEAHAATAGPELLPEPPLELLLVLPELLLELLELELEPVPLPLPIVGPPPLQAARIPDISTSAIACATV
jgi:hypothetical protein